MYKTIASLLVNSNLQTLLMSSGLSQPLLFEHMYRLLPPTPCFPPDAIDA